MLSRVRLVGQMLVAAAMLTGCAGSMRSPVTGFIYTDASAGEIATSNTAATKHGEACATSILGLVGTGDASIQAAMKDGDIKSVSYVDSASTGILGVYATYCTLVSGE